MADLTREEIIARVGAGADLAKENFYKLDLRGSNLSKANLSRANFKGVDLSGANLTGANLNGAELSGVKFVRADLSYASFKGANLDGANLIMAELKGAALRETNLRDSDLCSANLEDADLSGANLTGANLWNIATADWKIEGVRCLYAYNYKYTVWLDMEEKEKTRHNFEPGEFEQIHRSFPKLELIFKEEFSHLDHNALLAIINNINAELPSANLRLRRIENVPNNTTATLTAETKEAVKEVSQQLPEQYARVMNALDELQLQGLPSNQNQQALSPVLGGLLQMLSGPAPGKTLNLPDTVNTLGKYATFNVFTGPVYGTVQTGNNSIAIQNTMQKIDHLLDMIEHSDINDITLKNINQEFMDIDNNLDERGKQDLREHAEKIIEVKAKNNPGFLEKLKSFGEAITTEGPRIGKDFLFQCLFNYSVTQLPIQ